MRISSILKGPRRMRRVAHIARKAASHGLGFLISRLELQHHLPPWLRLPSRLGETRPEDMAVRLASMLEELGPTFVKFGQMLATRPDILPPEYIREFERICHHVAPFSAQVAQDILEEELEAPASELFSEFSSEPRASGSVAQIHDAILHDGTEVVVKVRRPRIEEVIEDDLAILEFLAAQADRVEEFRPFRLPMLVEEFARGINKELDFLAEAAYTHRFREEFREDDRIRVAHVFWDFTTTSVLTMGRLEGIHLSDLLHGAPLPVNRGEIARTLMDAYLRQFFTVGVFHGDPHPGNILITPDGNIGLLDFGLIGRVSASLRRDLGVCLLALGNDQLELVAEVLREMGELPDQEQAELFQHEMVALLERYSSVPLDKLDFQRSFHETMGVIRKYRVRVPRDFVLMGRALVAISGAVTQLDPSLDISSLAVPYSRKLLRQKVSPSHIQRKLTAASYHLGSLLSQGPRDIRRLVGQLRRGQFEFTIRHEGFDKGLTELDHTGNRLSLSIILAAIIMASATLLDAQVGAVTIFEWRVSILGLAGLLFGLILGVWLVVSILRSRRL